jgi:two-component system chemotaxis response regulator CheY
LLSLVVDDSKAARELAASALREAAAELNLDLDVLFAEGGMQALKLLASEEVTLLVTDLHLPDVHGLELLRFWKQTNAAKEGTALVMSTEVPQSEEEKILAAGASKFLAKPLSAAAFRDPLAALKDAGS